MPLRSIGQVSILIVDDDDIDRRAIRRAFAKQDIAASIVEATNGEEALQILLGENAEASIDRPYLVLLDLNMPLLDGHEFLERLRADPRLKDTIVFVLTTSTSESDIVRAYGKNVAGYLSKQEIGDRFMRQIRLLDLYTRSVEFPIPPG